MGIKEKLKNFVARKITVPVTAAVLVCGQGCAPEDKNDLNGTEQRAVDDMREYGPNFMMPIMEDLCEAADQDKIFGLEQSGSEACIHDLWQVYDNFVDVAEAGQIYTYYDPEKTSGTAFYDSGTIGVNKYEANLYPMGETDPPEAGDGSHVIIDFGMMLHEAAHKWVKHAFELDVSKKDSPIFTMSDEKIFKTVREQKDFPYLLYFFGGAPYRLISHELEVLNLWREAEWAYKNGEITAQEVYDGLQSRVHYELYEGYVDEEFGGDWAAADRQEFIFGEITYLGGIINLGFGISEDDVAKILEKGVAERYSEFREPVLTGFDAFVKEHAAEIRENNELTELAEFKITGEPTENNVWGKKLL